MKKNEIKKLICAGAAVIMAGVMSGCSVKFGTNKEPKLSAVVAHATNDERLEEMNVTYEMFRKEYKYFLVNSGIEDDTAESVAASCKSQRESIISYLINEQIILRKAREMGLYDLTEEEQKEVNDDFEEKLAIQIEYYGKQAEQELIASTSGEDGEKPSMTAEEREAEGNRRLDEMLAKCGMTRDDLLWWAQSSKITDKLQKAIGDTVPYSKAEEEFKGVCEYAEELYTTDMVSYVMNSYDQIWLPKGSRLIKHILIGFDDDAKKEITSLRGENKKEEADKLREEEAEKLKSKQEEIEEKLDNGEKIDDLIVKYSDDAEGSAAYPEGYTVIPNGITYMDEFQEAAFVPEKIGDRTTCVTDYGVHIMIYVGEAKISDEDNKEFTDFLYDQLKSKEFNEKMIEWLAEYAFEIDYEALGLEAPEESSEASKVSSNTSE